MADRHGLFEVGALLVQLGHGHSARHADGGALLPQQHGGGVHTVGRRDHEQGCIRGPQTRPQLTNKIRVSGGVDEVERHAVVGHGGDSKLHGAFFKNRLRPVVGRSGGNEVLEQGGLTCSAVPDEHHVADLGGDVGLRTRCTHNGFDGHGATIAPPERPHNPVGRIGTLWSSC